MGDKKSIEELKRLYGERLLYFKEHKFPLTHMSFDLSFLYDRLMSHEELTDLWDAYFSGLEKTGIKHNLHIYIHSPYCVSKCRYCNCDSIPLCQDNNLEDYVDYVVGEAEYLGGLARGYPVSTVYFGGGTVTIYPDDLFDRFLGGVINSFNIHPETYICCAASVLGCNRLPRKF